MLSWIPRRDFGVYFEITNQLGVPLVLQKCSPVSGDGLDDANQWVPNQSTIPNGQSRTLHLKDGGLSPEGAEGVVSFTADGLGGRQRVYAWRGNCPWSPASPNEASGPGITSPFPIPRTGNPLRVSITVTPETLGYAVVTPVEHVFVLMLENRSFDQMLGFSCIQGADAENGQPTAIDGLKGNESNTYNNKTYTVSPTADLVVPHDAGHEFEHVFEQLYGPAIVDGWKKAVDGWKKAVDAWQKADDEAKKSLVQPGAEPVYRFTPPYPTVDNSGYAASYASHTKGAVPPDGADPAEVMKCYAPTQLPVLTALAKEFAVCDNWRSSMPGPTVPNRFFAMAASSGGLDFSPTKEMAWWLVGVPDTNLPDIAQALRLPSLPPSGRSGFYFEHGSIFDALKQRRTPWRIYYGDQGHPLGDRLTQGVVGLALATLIQGISSLDPRPYSKFAADLQGSYEPQFTWIEPNYGDIASGSAKGGTSQHGIDDVRPGEALIKLTYEAIRNSPLWEKSLLIVTWDENGGFYDHAPGFPAPAPGDKTVVTATEVNRHGFDFTQYGPRVPAVIVSPYIKRNTIDHRIYDHSSIPATVERIFGLVPLTERDKRANDVTALLSLSAPRLSESDALVTLPNPAPGWEPELSSLSPVLSQANLSLLPLMYLAGAIPREEAERIVAAALGVGGVLAEAATQIILGVPTGLPASATPATKAGFPAIQGQYSGTLRFSDGTVYNLTLVINQQSQGSFGGTFKGQGLAAGSFSSGDVPIQNGTVDQSGNIWFTEPDAGTRLSGTAQRGRGWTGTFTDTSGSWGTWSVT